MAEISMPKFKSAEIWLCHASCWPLPMSNFGAAVTGHLVSWELMRRTVRRTVWRTVRQTHGPPALTTVTFWLSRSIVQNMNMMNDQ